MNKVISDCLDRIGHMAAHPVAGSPAARSWIDGNMGSLSAKAEHWRKELIAGKLRAAPTDAKPDDDDLFEEMVEEGYTALAESSNEWRGDPEASPASGRESFAVALRAALAVRTPAAQSVRDAAQPTAAPGKEA